MMSVSVRGFIMRHLLVIPVTLALASCAAIQPARMRLPDNLAAITTTVLRGLTGWNTGRFEAGDYLGTFRRSESTEILGDSFTRRAARAGFTVSGPGLESAIEGRCRMEERSLDAEAETPAEPMAYSCAFASEGQAIPAHLELRAVEGDETDTNRHERRGEFELDGERIAIASVHDVEGLAGGTLAPIGYVFEKDGQPIGALDLSSGPELKLPAGTEEDLARTLTLAALALAVLPDPAEGAIEE